MGGVALRSGSLLLDDVDAIMRRKGLLPLPEVRSMLAAAVERRMSQLGERFETAVERAAEALASLAPRP